MENNIEACLVCGSDLKYHNTAREMECKYCHRTFMSKTKCVNGHYVCDECHSNPAMIDIRNFCLASKSLNPIEIATELMRLPSVHMHGPEHHTLVGSALLTAYKNAGGKLESLDDALAEMSNRGSKMPGGACGFWGACGAGISSGMFVSIITGSTPLSRKPWGMLIEKIQFIHYNPDLKTQVYGLYGSEDTLAHFRPLYLEYYGQDTTFKGAHTMTAQNVREALVPLIKSLGL